MSDPPKGPTGPIIDELLCFMVNKMDMIDADSLVRLCVDTYSQEQIEESKERVFGYLHSDADETKFVKRRNVKTSETKREKDVRDIFQLLQEKGAAELPTFVAYDLGNLPPISFVHIDATAFMSRLERVQTKVDAMNNASNAQIEVSESMADSQTQLMNRVTSLEATFKKFMADISINFNCQCKK